MAARAGLDSSFSPNKSFLRTVPLVGFLFIVGTVGLFGDPEKTPMAPGLVGKQVWRPQSHLRSPFFSRLARELKGKPACSTDGSEQRLMLFTQTPAAFYIRRGLNTRGH